MSATNLTIVPKTEAEAPKTEVEAPKTEAPKTENTSIFYTIVSGIVSMLIVGVILKGLGVDRMIMYIILGLSTFSLLWNIWTGISVKSTPA